jgi:hypothetical protein
MRRHDFKESSSKAERKERSRMELIYIGVGIFLIWLVRTLHKIRARDQEEADNKIAFAKWAKEQQDPHIVSMVQNFMSAGRFKTWEEAATYAEQTLNPSSPERPSSSHAKDTEGTSS